MEEKEVVCWIERADWHHHHHWDPLGKELIEKRKEEMRRRKSVNSVIAPLV